MLVSLIIITLLLDYLLIYFTSSNFNQITLSNVDVKSAPIWRVFYLSLFL